jgi:beta-D-xylosidase 4
MRAGGLLFALLAALLPPGGASVLPYGHAFSDPDDFSAAQYDFIARTFPLFTVEKRHAAAVYGDASAPASSPFRFNSIAASVGTARKIKALNPAARVLMYWNSALHWNFYECEADVRAAWLLPPSHNLSAPSYNYAAAGFRTWWVACAIGALRNSSGALDGLFVDAAPKLSWPGQPADAFALWGEMMDAVRAAVPGAFLLFNGDFDSPRGPVVANATLLAHADAVYAESMSSIDSPAAAAAPAATIAYLRYLAESTAAAAAAGKRFAGHGLLDPADAARSFTFGLALFLLTMPDADAGFFLANSGYEVDQGLLVPHAEYALAFGAPRAPFSVAGSVLTRVFVNATVVADLAARRATIVMGPTAATATATATADAAIASSAPNPLFQSPAKLWPCDAADEGQVWRIVAGGAPHDNVLLGATGLLLNARGAVLDAWVVGNPPGPDQQWRFNATGGLLFSPVSGLCAAPLNSTPPLAGTPLLAVRCRVGDATARFAFDAPAGLFRLAANAALCLAVSQARNCSAAPLSALPYCNASLPAAERVADLVPRLSQAEAVSLLGCSNVGAPRLGLPPVQYGEALHGVIAPCGAPGPGGGSTGCATSFPCALAMVANLNRSLWRAAGEAVGTEARALHNQRLASSVFFAPVINELRDPRWGRAQEVPGEDPVLSGEYGVAWISGFQDDAGSGYPRAVSMVKHFSAYDQEGNKGPHDRSRFCATVEPKYLVSFFWPAFKAAVQAGVGGFMCSANGVNGQASCAHGDFTNGVVRGTWGWPHGFVVTDGNGIGSLWLNYGPASNGENWNCSEALGATGPTDAVRVGLRAGTDVELGETYTGAGADAIADGNITMADVNGALTRTLYWAVRLGLLDEPARVPWSRLGPADVDTPSSRQAALDGALQAMTLLQNNASAASPWGPGTPLLPLRTGAASKVKTMALIGPNANVTQDMLSNYHGANTLVEAHSPLLAITARAARDGVATTYSAGCLVINCTSGALIPAAAAAAGAADLAVVFLGLQPWHGGPGGAAAGKSEGEETDRSDIALPGQQLALLSAVVATGTPTVVVMIHGGCVGLEGVSTLAPAILEAFYPGELGGDAISSVLFGDTSPSGRLPYTAYATSFADSRSLIDYNMTSGDGITHLYYTGTPVFAFGTGLSYSSFAYELADGPAAATQEVDAAAWARGGAAAAPAAFRLRVTNVGAVRASVAALGFLEKRGAPGEPLQQLFDFARVHELAPGDSAVVELRVPLDVAVHTAADGEQALVPGELALRLGDTRASGNYVEARLRVTGARTVTFSLREALQRGAALS